MKVKHYPKDLFLKPESRQESDYLSKHTIVFRKLANGVKLLTTQRLIADTNKADLTFYFNSGALFDPPQSAGLHHLIEHLINKKIHDHASENDVSVNAATSFAQLFQTTQGTAHPTVRDYGIWPILPQIRQALANPIRLLDNPKSILETEKNVVYSEIAERDGNHYQVVFQKFRNFAFSWANPICIEPTGTKESVALIDIADIEKSAREIFIAQNLLIGSYCEGTNAISKTLIQLLEQLYADFPHAAGKSKEVNWETLNETNHLCKPGILIEEDTKLRTNLISIFFVWKCQYEPFSPYSFVLHRLESIITNKWFLALRHQGMSYVSQATRFTGGDNTSYFTLFLTVPKQPQVQMTVKTLLLSLTKEIFSSFDIKTITEIAQKEIQRQKAIPISAQDRHSWILEGLFKYKKMINADTIKAIYKSIGKEHFDFWIQKFLSEKPAIFIVGDLS